MLISKRDLLRIVREEVEAYKDQLNEINPSHIPRGKPGAGRFTQRGAGNVYSLTKNAEKEIGDSKTLKVQRGIETASGKVSSKFGQNHGTKQCGRKTMDGDNKPIARSCSHYPKNYWEKLDEAFGDFLFQESNAKKEFCDICIRQFLTRMNRANRAIKNAQTGAEPKVDEQQLTQPKSHYRGSPIDPTTRKSKSRAEAERTKRKRRQAGVYVEPFSREEKALLNPSSLSAISEDERND